MSEESELHLELKVINARRHQMQLRDPWFGWRETYSSMSRTRPVGTKVSFLELESVF
jgi:hypothetical protein